MKSLIADVSQSYQNLSQHRLMYVSQEFSTYYLAGVLLSACPGILLY